MSVTARAVDTVGEVWHGEPGDYCLNEARTVLWIRLPTDESIRLPVREGPDPGTVDGKPCWGLRVHEDGTISATPSIWLNQDEGPPTEWHGFLTRGVLA